MTAALIIGGCWLAGSAALALVLGRAIRAVDEAEARRPLAPVIPIRSAS